MAGVSDLKTMLRLMEPRLDESEFVFCTISEDIYSILDISPLLIYKEKEGITIVIEKEKADSHPFPYSSVWSLITLTVHSDLEAVGLLAAVTNKLAENGISTNVVSGYFHDHLFVPVKKASLAMKILKELSESS